MNNSGDICGYTMKVHSSERSYGFLRTADGTFIELERNDAGYSYARHQRFRNVVGMFTPTRSETSRAFIRKADGSITTFDLPDKSPYWVGNINKAGDVVGTSFWRYAFVRAAADGSFRTFELPEGGEQFDNLLINAKGTVAGSYVQGTGYDMTWHGFVAQPGGQAVRFDAPGLNGTTIGVDLNDKGEITGRVIGDQHQALGFIREP